MKLVMSVRNCDWPCICKIISDTVKHKEKEKRDGQKLLIIVLS